VRSFGEPFDRGEAPVPLRGQVGHGPGGLVEAVGLYLVENLPALFMAADQPGPLEHHQVLGDGLAGERHVAGQPAGADVTVTDQEIEDLAARRVGDRRPQLVIGLRIHPGWHPGWRCACNSGSVMVRHTTSTGASIRISRSIMRPGIASAPFGICNQR
jgi:hypothetical protein